MFSDRCEVDFTRLNRNSIATIRRNGLSYDSYTLIEVNSPMHVRASNASYTYDTLMELFVFRRLNDAQLRQYHGDGFLLVGETLTKRGLEEMRRQCTVAWTAKKGPFDPDGTWLKNSLLPNIHHHSKIACDFYFRGPLVDIAEQLIGPNIKGATSQLTFKLRGNTKPFGWHQDNGYGQLAPANAVTALTALDDTDTDNGCLWIKPRSHMIGQIYVANRMTVEAKKAGMDLTVDIDDHNAVPLPMRAGQSLIFHCHTLHKSEGNLSQTGDRRILFLRYSDADAVEVYNENAPRLGRLLCGETRFDAVRQFEQDL